MNQFKVLCFAIVTASGSIDRSLKNTKRRK